MPGMCEIIDRRQNQETLEWRYYVHYLSCALHPCASPFDHTAQLSPFLFASHGAVNRRMDEWVTVDRFDLGAHEATGDGKKVTRNVKRKFDESHHAEEEGELDPATLKEHEEATKVKNISRIAIGKYEMETWYFSPFPKEYASCDILYYCEFDLNYFARKEQLERYMRTRCKLFHPPGDEIYRHGEMAVYEIDSRVERVYCEVRGLSQGRGRAEHVVTGLAPPLPCTLQNLCLLAKLFLDHKTLYYDVQPFLFYVICVCDDQGAHMVGYFSKERISAEDYNLACILTLPCYQRRGYGKFMITISYELSKRDGKLGTPERPLSDLGLVSYRSYWASRLLEILAKHKGVVSIQELSDMTSFRPEDIISTLQALDLLKYFGGQHSIYVPSKMVEQYVNKKDNSPPVDPSKLKWTPHKDRKAPAPPQDHAAHAPPDGPS